MPGRLTPPMPESGGAAMIEQRVDQRAGGIARGGVNDHPGRFVDDDQVVVLVRTVSGIASGLGLAVSGSGMSRAKIWPGLTRMGGVGYGRARRW